MNDSIVVAIPCYNEGKFIGSIVRDTLEYAGSILVVDDGSTDNTYEEALKAGAHKRIRHSSNLGCGAATRTAFQSVKAFYDTQPDVLVTMDGDMQHFPEDIPTVAKPILDGDADIVIGSRFLKGSKTNMPFYRGVGIKVITWLLGVGQREKITDAQSCFRAYSPRACRELHITEHGFEFSIEILLQAQDNRLVIKEVPIRCLYHEEGSTINPIRHGVSVAWYIIKKRWLSPWDMKGKVVE